MSRLVIEMRLLVDMSLNLQSGIHSLDLSNSNPATRKVLQTADTLTQSLMCVQIAMDGLSREDANGFDGALDNVFLEDVRNRLRNGVSEDDAGRERETGVVELF